MLYLILVMAMGFTSQEARLGLRLTEGNATMAVAHIMSRRQVAHKSSKFAKLPWPLILILQ